MRRGWSVGAVHPGEKRPIGKWIELQKRRNNEWDINKLYRLNPNAGVGVFTGDISGILVVDIDPRNGGSIDGWPATGMMVTTGSGGTHLYYKMPAGGLQGYSSALGIDIQANGKFVVAPPTLHPDTHEPYIWDPDDEELGEIDLETIARLAPRKAETNGATVDSKRYTDPGIVVSEGGRNDTAARLAGYYAKNNIPFAQAIELISATSETNWKPPLPRKEIEATVRSIYKAEATKQNKLALQIPDVDEDGNPKKAGCLSVLRLDEYALKYGGQLVKWLVPGYVPDKLITFIYGPPGCFKTWVEFDLAVSIASGLPFFGLPDAVPQRTGPVLILQQEDAPTGIAERIATIYAGKLGLIAPEFDGDTLTLELPPDDLPIHIVEEQDFRFDDPAKVTALLKIIEEIKPIAVFFDPLYRMVPIEDNMQTAVELMGFLKELRRKSDINFFVIHHTTKSSTGTGDRQGMHGSQFINAFQENGLLMQKVSTVDGQAIMRPHSKAVSPRPPKHITWDIYDPSLEENAGPWRYSVSVKDTTIGEMYKLTDPEKARFSDGDDEDEDQPKRNGRWQPRRPSKPTPKPKPEGPIKIDLEAALLTKVNNARDGLSKSELTEFPPNLIVRTIRAGKLAYIDGKVTRVLTL